MLDIINTYTQETIQALRSLREQTIIELAKTEDAKKILSFLSKCCIVSIQDAEKTIWIGVPNEFIIQQVKKFFWQPLQTALRSIYAPGYTIQYTTLPLLADEEQHPLQTEVKTLLHIESKPKTDLESSLKEELTEYFGILFEKKYRFHNFVVWANNQLAHAAAQAVSQSPGDVYNPLFIYGNVGLGKTHLMQAIGNEIIEHFPDKIVLYLPTTKFIDQVVTAIRQNSLPRLMDQLNEIDVLMLDDIQFLAGKDKTQEIFHNIFNDFYAQHKQIVLTSDQPPKALTLLEARLQSRFAIWLIVDIQQPDVETRKAILQMKLKQKGTSFSDDVVSFLADHITSNIRELEWVLNILLTQQHVLWTEIELSHAEKALQTMWISIFGQQPTPVRTEESSIWISSSHHIQVDTLLDQIAHHFWVEKEEVLWQGRAKELSQARQVAMYLIKTKLGRSLQRIGDLFGGRNHASVIYAIQICEQELQRQPQLRKFVQSV